MHFQLNVKLRCKPYLLTYLLTHSMVQSPSWAANWFAASQEIPRISRNPKAHYRTHKSPPPVSILGQSNPVHIPTSHLLEIHPNIIHLYVNLQQLTYVTAPKKISPCLYSIFKNAIVALNFSFLKFIFGIKLYMFRTVSLSIIRRLILHTQQ